MMQATYNHRLQSGASGFSKDKVFQHEISHLLLGKKAGHLAPYHYGEALYNEDPVQGAFLWDKFISTSSAYYQFSSENDILLNVARYISDELTDRPVSLMDFGPGSGSSLKAKTYPFLSCVKRIDTYIPVDICAKYLQDIEEDVFHDFPYLNIASQQKNYFENIIHYNVNSEPVCLFLSSSISNLPSAFGYQSHLKRVLSHFYRVMQRTGFLIISHDTNQDETSLVSAYNDPYHIQFSLNILHRMQRDAFDQDSMRFSPDAWVYRPEWFSEEHVVAHSLYATDDQLIEMNGKAYPIKRGQRLIVDNSHKYPINDFVDICQAAGFVSRKIFIDQSQRIAVHVLQRV